MIYLSHSFVTFYTMYDILVSRVCNCIDHIALLGTNTFRLAKVVDNTCFPSISLGQCRCCFICVLVSRRQQTSITDTRAYDCVTISVSAVEPTRLRSSFCNLLFECYQVLIRLVERKNTIEIRYKMGKFPGKQYSQYNRMDVPSLCSF